MANRMILNETSYFGKGAIENVPTEFKARGFKKAAVITDKDLVKFEVATQVTKLLDEAGVANDCLVAPAFLFSNDTNGLRLNYTRLAKDDLPRFQEQFTKITQQLKEQTYERNH